MRGGWDHRHYRQDVVEVLKRKFAELTSRRRRDRAIEHILSVVRTTPDTERREERLRFFLEDFWLLAQSAVDFEEHSHVE